MSGWLKSPGVVGFGIVGAGVNGGLGVAMGAWAAHGAAAVLEPAAVDWIRTGAAYALWHAAALLGIAALARAKPAICLGIAAICCCFGALAFSCSLYLLALAGWHWTVWVTPLGGALMIAGWVALILHGLRLWRGNLS